MRPGEERKLIRADLEVSGILPANRQDWGSFNRRKFQAPEPDPADPGDSVWGKFVVTEVPRSERAMGFGSGNPPTWREGVLTIAGFGASGFGLDALEATLALFSKRYHRKTLTSSDGLVTVQFRDAPSGRSVGETGVWHQMNLSLRFYVEDRSAA